MLRTSVSQMNETNVFIFCWTMKRVFQQKTLFLELEITKQQQEDRRKLVSLFGPQFCRYILTIMTLFYTSMFIKRLSV